MSGAIWVWVGFSFLVVFWTIYRVDQAWWRENELRNKAVDELAANYRQLLRDMARLDRTNDEFRGRLETQRKRLEVTDDRLMKALKKIEELKQPWYSMATVANPSTVGECTYESLKETMEKLRRDKVAATPMQSAVLGSLPIGTPMVKNAEGKYVPLESLIGCWPEEIPAWLTNQRACGILPTVGIKTDSV